MSIQIAVVTSATAVVGHRRNQPARAPSVPGNANAVYRN
jgi:hypothetical protein